MPTGAASPFGASAPSRLRRCMPLGASTVRAPAVGPARLSTVMVPLGLGGAGLGAVAGGFVAAAAFAFLSFSSFSRRSAFFLFVSKEPPSNSRLSRSLYSSNDPLNTRTYPGSGGSFSMSPFFTCQISSTTSEMSRSSCDTSTTPPSKLFNAIARASMVSRSRWFVGSSRSMMCGCFHASSANARRDFCPPDRNLTGLVANSPLRPNLPRYARASSSGISESKLFMCATQSSSRFMDSRWCWLNLASRSLVCRLTHPCVGRMSPSRSLRKVDLPAPLGPTMATLESMSRPKSRFSYRVSYPSYPKDTFMTEMHCGQNTTSV